LTGFPTLSIVIPAYNEEQRLPPALDRVRAYLDASTRYAEVEILIVDDGSRDGTAALVDSVSRTDPRVRLLRNPGNRGKGYSVRHGMLEARHDWVLFSDADLSAPIEELDKLLDAALVRQAQVAIGSRALDRSLIGVHQGALREFAGIVLNRVMRVVTGLPFADTQCGFKLFHRDAARRIFSRQQLDGFTFDVEDLYLARLLNIPAVEVPVRWNNVEGTKVGVMVGPQFFLDLVSIHRHRLAGKYR
jgi:glycosyltransferase involved in cell wall biosynthesis